jgi:hypothetical protein
LANQGENQASTGKGWNSFYFAQGRCLLIGFSGISKTSYVANELQYKLCSSELPIAFSGTFIFTPRSIPRIPKLPQTHFMINTKMVLLLAIALLGTTSCAKVKVHWLSPLTRRLDFKIKYRNVPRHADASFWLAKDDPLIVSIEACLSQNDPQSIQGLMQKTYPNGRTPFGTDPLDALFRVPMVQLSLKGEKWPGRIVINKFGDFIYKEGLFTMKSSCFDDLRWLLIERFVDRDDN